VWGIEYVEVDWRWQLGSYGYAYIRIIAPGTGFISEGLVLGNWNARCHNQPYKMSRMNNVV